MTNEKSKKYFLARKEELSPRVAGWFSIMEALRERLLRAVSKMSEEEIDFTPHERKVETIGTLLLHIAAVEWSWIFEDIDGKELDFEEWKYAFPLRAEVNLPQLKGQGKQFYLDRLKKVRNEIYQRLLELKDEDLDTLVGQGEEKYSIEWILFHIIEHEAMHLGQIQLISRLYRLNKKD